MPLNVVVYSTPWCPDCWRARQVLIAADVPFEEIDVDRTPGAEYCMRLLNGGSGKVPTIVIESRHGYQVLIEPGDEQLAEAIRCHREPEDPHA